VTPTTPKKRDYDTSNTAGIQAKKDHYKGRYDNAKKQILVLETQLRRQEQTIGSFVSKERSQANAFAQLGESHAEEISDLKVSHELIA